MPVVQNDLLQHITLKNFCLKSVVLMLNDSLPAHAQHLWSSEANQSSIITARNCFPFLNVRYNWSKSLHGVYLAKNNQTKTIWMAGKLLADANENMFKMINMKDLHNFMRNYSWKKARDWTVSFCTLCSLDNFCFAFDMIYWVAAPAFYLTWLYLTLCRANTTLTAPY